jgi:uncharacterized protein (TIGR03067 family)
MKWQVLLIAAAVLGLAAEAQKDDDKKELGKLKGNWTVTSYERDKRQLPAEKAKEIKYSVMDEKLILKDGIGFTNGKEHALKLDATKKPMQIDITPADGKNKGKAFQGICQIEGDTLKVCVAAPGKERPKEFATKDGSFTILMTWQKDKP